MEYIYIRDVKNRVVKTNTRLLLLIRTYREFTFKDLKFGRFLRKPLWSLS